ncbi:MAG: hypothetical protein AB1352_04560 [Patescibacteria group bacterium]
MSSDSIDDDEAEIMPHKEFDRVSATISFIFDEHTTPWELVKKVAHARGSRREIMVPKSHSCFQSVVAMNYLSTALLRITKEIMFITHDPELQERIARFGLPAYAPHDSQEEKGPSARGELIHSFFGRPMQSFQYKKKKSIRGWGWASFLILVVVLFIFTAITPRAHVTIIPEVNVIERRGEALINAAWRNQQRERSHLRGELFTSEGSYATTSAITELSESGEKAEGEVRVENQTGQEVVLTPGTEFITDNGVVYVNESALTIPAASVAEDTTITFGTLTAMLSAKEPGVEGNRASGRLIIPSLPFSKQQRVGAVITSPFVGGSDRMGKVVRQEHVDALKPVLWDQLQTALLHTVESRVGDEWRTALTLTTATVTRIIVDPPLGREADTVTVEMGGAMRALAFSSTDAFRALGVDTKSCSEFQNNKTETCVIRVDTVDNLDVEKGDAKAELVFSKIQVSSFDTSALVEKITGRSVQQARLALLSLTGVKDVRIALRWSLRNYLPRDSSRITIEVVPQELTQP